MRSPLVILVASALVAGAYADEPRPSTEFTGLLRPLAGLLPTNGGVAEMGRVDSGRDDPRAEVEQAGAGDGEVEDEKQKGEGAEEQSFIKSPVDGMFDVSRFLASRTGFLPIAMPITEPAVGYGLAVGLTFFHDRPKRVPAAGGEGERYIMPSATVVMGAATDNGTWATGFAHLGIWNEGKVRYVGAVGYASLNLDWYGQDNALGGNSIAYTNEVLFVMQSIKFQIEGTDLFIGPAYRFIGSDSRFDGGGGGTGIPRVELESQTSGLGVEFTYDSLDQPYGPTTGSRVNFKFTQHDEALGGDFDYAKVETFAIHYVPVSDNLVLGMKLNADYVGDDAPFYDLPGVNVRGLDRGRYVDNAALYGEIEARYDLDRRWSLIGFGSGGSVGESFDDLSSAHWAGGGGFRYLIAEEFGLRLGMDLAYGDGKATVYIGIGTGWIRP